MPYGKNLKCMYSWGNLGHIGIFNLSVVSDFGIQDFSSHGITSANSSMLEQMKLAIARYIVYAIVYTCLRHASIRQHATTGINSTWTCHVSCKVANSWASSSWTISGYWHTSIRHWTTIRHCSSWTLDMIKGTSNWASDWAVTCYGRTCVRHWASSSVHSTSTMHVIRGTSDRACNWACTSISSNWSYGFG